MSGPAKSIIPASAVFDRDLSNAAVRVIAALGTYTDSDGRCWPSTTTLATRTGMSERHVRSCLRDLENRGHIKTEKRPGQSSVFRIPRQPSSGVRETTPEPECRGGGDNPGTRVPGSEGYPGTIVPLPRNQSAGDPGTTVPPNLPKNLPKNEYAFDGKVVRLKLPDLARWKEAYPNLDLRAELQALDDYYDTNLTGTDRKKWFARCSSALAKKNARARSDRPDQSGETRFNDGVCD